MQTLKELTHGLFRHHARDISFTLVVGGFGIKYTNADDLQHLITTLREIYKVTIDLSGTLYCGLTLKWDYNKRHVNVSMPGYIKRILQEYLELAVRHKQDYPHPWKRST